MGSKEAGSLLPVLEDIQTSVAKVGQDTEQLVRSLESKAAETNAYLASIASSLRRLASLAEEKDERSFGR